MATYMRKILAGLGAVVLMLPTWVVYPEPVGALDTSLAGYLSSQQYNNLVSDADFTDINSMSVEQIQAFLTAKGGYLATAPPEQLGEGAAGRTAAQIIYDAAHGLYEAAVDNLGYVNSTTGTISPKAILITLQKEQSLITRTTYDQGALDKAMGYGCPDSNNYGCPDSRHPEWKGFSNQVGWAAWQLRFNTMVANSSVAPYYVGNVTSIADWDAVRSVFFSNKATASLFRYTPHTHYGNYNFWRLGVEWFGFGVGSVSGGDGVNDTSSVTARFYSNHGTYQIKSIKQSGVTVSYNGTVIAPAGSQAWQYELDPSIGTHDYIFTYSNNETKTVTVEKRKNGDINGDGVVNLLDLSLIGVGWGQTVKDDDWTNLNPDVDSEINLLDISIFANNWEG